MTERNPIDELWEQVFAAPRGTEFDIGRLVACDFCGKDWTNAPESGGYIFLAKGVCPDCAPRFLRSVRECNEEHYIRAHCPPDKSFADFVREYRGSDTKIAVVNLGKL